MPSHHPRPEGAALAVQEMFRPKEFQLQFLELHMTNWQNSCVLRNCILIVVSSECKEDCWSVRQKIQSAPEAPDSELMPPLALQGMLFADCFEYIGLGRIICKFEPIDDKAMA